MKLRSRPLRAILMLVVVAVLATIASIAYVASLAPKPMYNARPVAVGAAPRPGQQWTHFAGDAEATQFSPLAQITPDNAGKLELAWTMRTGEQARHPDQIGKSSFATTPIIAAGSLITCTPWNRVIALDPATGRTRWEYDPKVTIKLGGGNRYVCRGVAQWHDRAAARPSVPCADRIIYGTNDARIIALDARTGRLCPDFGRGGIVKVDVPQSVPGEMKFNAPPAIVGDVAVFGSFILDGFQANRPLGTVRAFDTRTGKVLWTFDPVPQERDAVGWKPGQSTGFGGGNVWADMSVDEKRNLVFLPTSAASVDLYGGQRLGDNRYANSVVALDATTGKRVWDYQVVHHDAWDFDLPTAPILADLKVGDKMRAAAIQLTKMGMIFVLDRTTGKPLYPIEERAVPQGSVAGERLSPTQPFPVTMPSLMPQRLDEKDAWGFTPIDREACRRKIAAYPRHGLYMPPSLEGTLMFPLATGGTNMGMRAYDPQRKLLIANTIRVAGGVKLVKRVAKPEDAKLSAAERAGRSPYTITGELLVSPLGIPCNPPPWGALTAIDMETQKILWSVPLGSTEKLAALPIALDFGTPNRGGPIATGGGVIFVAATMDNAFRAFSTATGRQLFKARLPAGGQATPMTYMANGRQYVVIAAGGHDTMKTTPGDYLLAYALPTKK